MKRILMTVAAALTLTACVGPMHVTSVPMYNNSVDAVVAGIESMGYMFVGRSHDTRNERRHAVPHMEGDNTYSAWIPNDIVNVDTYNFADSAGNTMSFTVQFSGGIDPKDKAFYYNDVSVVGCSTSDKRDSERLCGEQSPVWTLDTIKKDMTVKP